MSSVYPFSDIAPDADTGVVPPCKSTRPQLAVVRVGGDDAREFLHGQFSADLRALQAGHTVLTAWCSPKGRVLFLPRLLRGVAGDYFALLPLEQSAAFIKRLRMFVLRAKVVIDDCAQSHGVLVVDGADPGSVPNEVVIAIDGERRWLVGPREQLAQSWQALRVPAQGATAATLSDIARGEVSLAASLGEQFLPQELNLDLVAGVSFNKGCYPGQEIVARVKFRGAVKRRLQRVRIAAAATAADVGARLLDTDGAHHGTVLESADCAAGGCEALAVLDIDAGALHLADDLAATVTCLPLPYPLPGA